MEAAGSSSSKQSSAFILHAGAQLCLDDDGFNEGGLPFHEPLTHVDSSVVSSNITAKNLLSFLQTLLEVYKSPSKEKTILTLASEAVLDEKKSNYKDEFLQNVLDLVEICFVEAEVEKNPQKKAIRLENEFSVKRSCSFHHFSIKHSWEKLMCDKISESCGETEEYMEASGQILQQILQNFWSSPDGSRVTVKEENSTEESATYCDDSEFDSIRDHAGWVIKRARDTIVKGESCGLKAVEKDGGSNVVCGEKDKALDLIASLGRDVQQDDGKFRFIIYEHVVPFFLFLHNTIESLINPVNIQVQKGNILVDCLEKLSTNKLLREKWNNLLTSLPSDATSVVVLQRIVTFFLKSKQQMIREKKGLKPNKDSMGIRQQIRQTTSSSKKQRSEEIFELRSGDMSSANISSFLQSLSAYPHSKQEEMLRELQGKELAKILKSLGKPSLLGKKKNKQIETLLQVIKR